MYTNNITQNTGPEAIDELRAPGDKIDVLVDRKVWPMPTYGELLFEI